MKIVIDIPEEIYKFIKISHFYGSDRRSGRAIEQTVINGIRNGTPLPEMYGRLGDLDELEQRISNFIEHDAHMQDEYTLIRERFILDGIKDTHTIIEANMEAENES